MLLAVSLTQDSGGREIVEKLARRLDMPYCDASAPGESERAGKLSATGPCILLTLGGGLPPDASAPVQVLLHAGHTAGECCAGPVRYDLTVDVAPLGTEGTVELLSQFVALKVMALRGRTAPSGSRYA